jgi:hypothetical protein
MATTRFPTPAEALGEPFSAFPSWFLRIECDQLAQATATMLQRRISQSSSMAA